MIQLEKISITNYRCFKEFECPLNSFSCLIGINGVGKSNFLKAISEFPRSALSKATKNTEANYSDEQKIQYHFYTDRPEKLTIQSSFHEIILTQKSFIIQLDEQQRKLIECSTKFQIKAGFINVELVVGKEFDLIDSLKIYLMDHPHNKMAQHLHNKLTNDTKRFSFVELISSYKELLEFEHINQFLIETNGSIKRSPFMLYGKEESAGSSHAYSSISQEILGGINAIILSTMMFRLLYPTTKSFFTQNTNLSTGEKNEIIPVKSFLTQQNIDNAQLLRFDRTTQLNLFQELSKEMNSILYHYPQIWNSIQIKFDIAERDQLRITYLLDGQKEINFSDLSAGQQWFLHFVFDLYDVLSNPHKNGVLLIDEPGLNLHLGAQFQILKILKTFQKDFQVIYTTHMPHLIDYQNPKSVICLTYDVETRKHLINPTAITHFKLKIAEILDVPKDLIFKFPEHLFLVEGPSDKLFIDHINQFLHMDNPNYALSTNISINHYNGIEEIPHMCKLFDAMVESGENFDFFILYDDDSDDFQKHPKKNPANNPECQKFPNRILNITHSEIKANVAIEDFIPPSYFLPVLNKFLSSSYGEEKLIEEFIPNFKDLTQSQIISKLKHLGELSKINFIQFTFESINPDVFVQDENILKLFKTIQSKFDQ